MWLYLGIGSLQMLPSCDNVMKLGPWSNITSVLTWGEDGHMKTQRQGRMLCKDGGRDRRDAFTNQRMPWIASHHQKLGKKHETDFSEAWRGTNWINTFIVFPTSGLQNCENKFFCYKPHSLWYFVIATPRNSYRRTWEYVVCIEGETWNHWWKNKQARLRRESQ